MPILHPFRSQGSPRPLCSLFCLCVCVCAWERRQRQWSHELVAWYRTRQLRGDQRPSARLPALDIKAAGGTDQHKRPAPPATARQQPAVRVPKAPRNRPRTGGLGPPLIPSGLAQRQQQQQHGPPPPARSRRRAFLLSDTRPSGANGRGPPGRARRPRHQGTIGGRRPGLLLGAGEEGSRPGEAMGWGGRGRKAKAAGQSRRRTHLSPG